MRSMGLPGHRLAISDGRNMLDSSTAAAEGRCRRCAPGGSASSGVAAADAACEPRERFKARLRRACDLCVIFL